MKKVIILCILISIGFANSLYASTINKTPHHPVFNFKKKHSGVIKGRGHGRGKPPKVRSGYSINKKK
jgi:hypothetical protein